MLRHAKDLLDACATRFPSPRSGQRHNLVVMDGVLVLTLMMGDTWQSFNLNDVDLDRPVNDLVDDLAALFEPTLDAPDPSPSPVQIA